MYYRVPILTLWKTLYHSQTRKNMNWLNLRYDVGFEEGYQTGR